MKKLLSLILCLGLMGLTAACGPTGEPDPDSVPAPEIVDAETIQADPFAAYFDLSGLSQETLDGAIQTINQETTSGEISVVLLQTLNDEHTLYAAFDVTWPQDMEPPTEFAQATLSYHGTDTTFSGEMCMLQATDQTASYIACFPGSLVPACAEAALEVSVLDQVFTFSWTVDNSAPLQVVHLEDSEGTAVGSAWISPFHLGFLVNDPYISGIADGDTIQLLDETGAPLPETWATSGDPSAAFLEFFVPMELGTVKTLQVGPYTAHF